MRIVSLPGAIVDLLPLTEKLSQWNDGELPSDLVSRLDGLPWSSPDALIGTN
jgi:hypothetical protein